MSLALDISNCKLQLAENLHFDLTQLQIAKAEQIALTGPSGCGKSTLLNLAGGILKPDSGQVVFLGKDLATLSSRKLDKVRGSDIGIVYQKYQLLPNFSVAENILMAKKFGSRRSSECEDLDDLIDKVGLSHRANTHAKKLSSGESQRVAIARALINKPKLILADEPTGALDPKTGITVFELLANLCQKNQCALMLVTHDMQIADRLPKHFDCSDLLSLSA